MTTGMMIYLLVCGIVGLALVVDSLMSLIENWFKQQTKAVVLDACGMFLSYLGIKLGRLMRDKQTKFETWSEFKAWIDKQAELENHLAGNVQIVKGNGNVQAGGDVWKDKQ
ncbi:hypothetical protein [Neisseria iguanae]|uniref:hypothetical protein n=1 Tax=Neisseria iguanae TaxID=90242 RepID=UPI001FE69A9C|nr:hypothetical protein [Neisseria iguanae]